MIEISDWDDEFVYFAIKGQRGLRRRSWSRNGDDVSLADDEVLMRPRRTEMPYGQLSRARPKVAPHRGAPRVTSTRDYREPRNRELTDRLRQRFAAAAPKPKPLADPRVASVADALQAAAAKRVARVLR